MIIIEVRLLCKQWRITVLRGVYRQTFVWRTIPPAVDVALAYSKAYQIRLDARSTQRSAELGGLKVQLQFCL